MRKKQKMKCNFTLHHYKETLELAKSMNYCFSTFKDYERNKNKNKIIILRHDVDFDVKNIYHLLKIENELNIQATYFFRLHSKENLFSLNNYKLIKMLLKNNHEIGLHHEFDFSEIIKENWINQIKAEKKIIETMFKIPLVTVCPHEPSRTNNPINEENIKLTGFLHNPYSKKFMTELKYISDSSARWREGCMCNFIKKETPRLQILVHPFWWYNKSPLERY
jgi:hypothetical protein